MAIVGPTGAGKTTLVNLIMRFYELDAGRITLDGVDIAAVPRAKLRSQIGMVLQDTWLFHGTIWDNIAYGRPDAGEAEIQAAAEATYVDRFVHTLPDGYQTVIDEEGSNISAGEKQLITIARAFLADPALLILDEATSSVDTRTEVLVQRAMAALRSERTSFVIAHRLSTIRDADVILVMERGRIVEQGSHAELLQARGAYFELYEAQFNAAIEDGDVQNRSPDARNGQPPRLRGFATIRLGTNSGHFTLDQGTADHLHHLIRMILKHPPGEPEHHPAIQHHPVLPPPIDFEDLDTNVVLTTVDLECEFEPLEADVHEIRLVVDLYRQVGAPPTDPGRPQQPVTPALGLRPGFVAGVQQQLPSASVAASPRRQLQGLVQMNQCRHVSPQRMVDGFTADVVAQVESGQRGRGQSDPVSLHDELRRDIALDEQEARRRSPSGAPDRRCHSIDRQLRPERQLCGGVPGHDGVGISKHQSANPGTHRSGLVRSGVDTRKHRDQLAAPHQVAEG